MKVWHKPTTLPSYKANVTKKKYCKIWGVVLPPLLPHPPPLLKWNLFSPPPLRLHLYPPRFLPFCFSCLIYSHTHPTPIFHVLPSSLSPPHPSYVIMSCHCVMSYRHVILSYTHVILSRVNLSCHYVIHIHHYIIQTKYEYIWIIYM